MSKLLHFLLCFLFLMLTSACLKTTEQIEREKKVDNLSQELSQSHKTVADLMLQVKELQGKLNNIHGQMEEAEYKQNNSQSKEVIELKKQINLMNEQMAALQTDNKDLKEKMASLQEAMISQKEFIEKVTHSLGKMAETKEEKPAAEAGTNSYDEAMALVKDKKNKKAKEAFLAIIADKNQPASTLNKSHFQLGLIEYKAKNYDEALVYFSKVYTQYPESSIAPAALYHIGKSFKAQKKDEEANSSFSELLEKYPKAKEAALAKKELK